MRFIILMMVCLLSTGVLAKGLSHGTYGAEGEGYGTCGGKNQKACQPTSAMFDSDAVGSCPTGTFFDLANWGCWSCPEGFNREITTANIDSDRACQRAVKSGEKKNPRYEKAAFTNNACAGDAFYDPINSGTCWTCPAGYVRSVARVDGNDACVVLPKENLKPAKDHAVLKFGARCPGSQFWDVIDNKCHSCPSGYVRTGYSVHDSKACSKYVKGKMKKATLVGSSSCQDGEFNDFLLAPKKGGACYACPDGYDRTVFEGANTAKACETTPDLFFARASNNADLTCPSGAIFDFVASNHYKVRRIVRDSGVAVSSNPTGGTCWNCPPGGYRSWDPIWADTACMAAATDWVMPTYIQPGLFGIKYGEDLVVKLLQDKTQINAIAISMAKNKTFGMTEAEVLEQTWVTIADSPQGSGPLLLAVYARLQEAALHPSSALKTEGDMLVGFQNAVRDYRIFHAEEALNAFDFWEDGATYRYTHPDFYANPRSAVAMLFWASIGLPGPPDPAPDFSTLTYEYVASEVVGGASIDLSTVEALMAPEDFQKILPSDPAAELAAKYKTKAIDAVQGSLTESAKQMMKRRFSKKVSKSVSKQVSKALTKEAIKRTGKLTGSLIAKSAGKAAGAAVSSMGPQIAIALAAEFADGWISAIATNFEARPLLKVNLVDQKKRFVVKDLIGNGSYEGASEVKQQFKSIMSGWSTPKNPAEISSLAMNAAGLGQLEAIDTTVTPFSKKQEEYSGSKGDTTTRKACLDIALSLKSDRLSWDNRNCQTWNSRTSGVPSGTDSVEYYKVKAR